MGLEPEPLPGGPILPPREARGREGPRGGLLSLYRLLRPLLFSLDAEDAHHLAQSALTTACAVPGAASGLRSFFAHADPILESTVAGLRFPNPVGLAAGFDKDARLAHALPALGFGFLELGTVTPRPQPGNPRPRLFRAPEARALINRMGFNNDGAEAMAGRLARLKRRPIPIGVNLGINKDTPPEGAPAEYAAAFAALEPHGDYFVVNVSSPNTPGLRGLQQRSRLEAILAAIDRANPRRRPVFVKLAPDLSDAQLEDLLPPLAGRAAGLICSNTTLSRDGVAARWQAEAGGLSGAPLRERATRMIALARRLSGGKAPIIGVGGILSAEDAYEKVRAGACLLQVYTGLVYEGPGLPGQICRGLARRLRADGFARLEDAVGTGT